MYLAKPCWEFSVYYQWIAKTVEPEVEVVAVVAKLLWKRVRMKRRTAVVVVVEALD